MKQKSLWSIMLIALVIVSILINIYQFISNNTLKQNQHSLEADVENLQNESNTLDADLKEKKESLLNLSSELEELQSTIDSLESSNETLLENLNELKATQESIEESNADIGLTDDEIFDSIWEELEKENPELFSNEGNSGTTYTQGDYEHVGTPDSGELPPSTFGQGDYSEGAGAIVY